MVVKRDFQTSLDYSTIIIILYIIITTLICTSKYREFGIDKVQGSVGYFRKKISSLLLFGSPDAACKTCRDYDL